MFFARFSLEVCSLSSSWDSRYRPGPTDSCLYVLYGHYVDTLSVYALVTYVVQAYLVRHQ